MKSILRTSLLRAVRTAETYAWRRGYRLSWMPPAVLKHPQGELGFDLEFVIAHLMLHKPDIFFIQIGANDGCSNDPLHKFVTRFGWCGILLEPLPEVFMLLQQTYAANSRLVLLNAAISERDGRRTIYTIRQDASTFAKAHQFSSFSREALMRQTDWVPDVAARIEEKSVDCMCFGTLLEKYVQGGIVDILVTDTEGYDLAVLQMIDFGRMRPAIICYEHAHMAKAEQDQAAQLLLHQGYQLTRDNLDTVGYRPFDRFGFR